MSKNKQKSISNRISFVFAIIMIICVGTILIFNTFFLEKIYTNKRAQILKKSYTVLNSSIMNGFKEGYDLKDMLGKNNAIIGPGVSPYSSSSFLGKFIQELQDTYNVTAVICDEDSNIYSLWKNPRMFDRILFNYKKNGIEVAGPNAELIEQTEKYQILKNGMAQSSQSHFGQTLECWGYFDDNKTSFLLSTPLMSIKEPIRIFNSSILKLSLFILFVGAIIIYLVSNKISMPIKKLANLAKKMTALDFSEKYNDNRNDEIDILGKSMNQMSDKLEKTISDLQKANVQLQEDLNQKEKLDIMRQEFVANVSHELKTPIALIQGYAEGLTEGLCDDKDSRDYYCNVIMDEANKMNKIVRQLLNLSSIEKGNEELELENIELKDLVTSIKQSCNVLLENKNVDVDINIDENIVIKADELKSEEVIKNYLTNAINHVDENKIIKIFTNKTSENKIRFCIYNSGVLLSDENIKLIWEKFYKVDKAHTRSYGGTGLGLPIVKAIATQHNTECGCYNVHKNDEFLDGIIFYFDFELA